MRGVCFDLNNKYNIETEPLELSFKGFFILVCSSEAELEFVKFQVEIS